MSCGTMFLHSQIRQQPAATFTEAGAVFLHRQSRDCLRWSSFDLTFVVYPSIVPLISLIILNTWSQASSHIAVEVVLQTTTIYDMQT